MKMKQRLKEIINEFGIPKSILVIPLKVFFIILEKCYIYYIKNNIPVNPNRVLFRSTPDFSDNSRVLAEYMIDSEYTKSYEVWFAVRDASKFNKKNKISFVSYIGKYGQINLKYTYLKYTSGYLLDTHANILGVPQKRKEQVDIRLWHGCGYKDKSKLGPDGKVARQFDAVLVPGELFVKPKSRFWNVDPKYVWPIGYPRYDWLKGKDEDAYRLYYSYKSNIKTKVLLWMPTFRNDKNGRYVESSNITQFPLISSINQWKELDSFCQNNNVILLIKLHRLQPAYNIPFNSFTNIKEINDGLFEELDLPMYKFIALTDGLISDYSSIAVDYLIVDRPIAFTLDDFEAYKKTRGVVFEDPREYMPGHHLYSFTDLVGFISDISKGRDPYHQNRKDIYGMAITYSEHYCKDVLDKIGIKKN